MATKSTNLGYGNSGCGNSGDRNSGYWNSGYGNSGCGNSGDRNSGYWNSGNWNSGYGNSGCGNSGDRNSGYWNSGNKNSGNWNSGYGNSGFLNTDNPKVRIFNKETDVLLDDISFPNFFCFELNEWIEESEMTDKEKEAYPSYVTTGGYLKCRDYKQAWRESYAKATQEDREKVYKLPNFDAKIFEEITGIDLNQKPSLSGKEVEVKLDGVTYKAVIQ